MRCCPFDIPRQSVARVFREEIRQHRLGIGPLDTQPDSTVCVFCSAGLIFTFHGLDDVAAALIRDVYVYGLMGRGRSQRRREARMRTLLWDGSWLLSALVAHVYLGKVFKLGYLSLIANLNTADQEDLDVH